MSSCVLSDFFLQRAQGARLRCLVCVFLVCTLLVCLSVAGCAEKKDNGLSWGAMAEIEADRDAWVSENGLETNYGDDSDLYVGYYSPKSQENIYLHFDLSFIPSTSAVVSAELWLYISQTYNSHGTGYLLGEVGSAWDEYLVTWDDAPTTTPACAFAGPAQKFSGWYKIASPALTAVIRHWVAGTLANNGLAITPSPSATSDDGIWVNSRENDSGNSPKLVVYYNPLGYKLTVTADPADSGTVDTSPTSPDGYYESGAVVTLTAIPNEGYEFTNWSGDLSGTENPITVTMDSDKTVTANFIPLWSATAEVETYGDAWVWEDDPTTNYGDDVDLYLGHPYIGGGEEDIYLHFDLSSVPSTASVVLVELWLYISLTFNQYGTGYSLEAVSGAWDESLITWENAPASTSVCTLAGPEDGFSGWYKITDPAMTAKVREWVSNPSGNNGLAIKPLPSAESDDEMYVESRETGNAPKLVVRYNPSGYKLTVTADPADSGTVDTSPTSPDGYYDSGAVVTLTATANEGYEFTDWSGDLSGAENPTAISMYSDKTVTANFILQKRFFTVNPDYGEPSPAAGTYEYDYGSTVNANCGPNPYPPDALSTRYFCTGHAGTGNVADGAQTTISFAITVDSSVTWTWQTQHYLTIVSDYGDPEGEGWYDEGTTATWSVTSPWPGGAGVRYVADPVSGDVEMNSPQTETVSWTIQYSLTTAADPPDGGSVTPSDETWHNKNAVVPLAATANQGYEFTNWSGGLSGTENPTTVPMDSAKAVTANFTPLWSETAEVETDGDAWVWEDEPTTNYGDDVDLYAGRPYTGGGEEDIYLHFNLSSIPGTATVVLAELWLYVSLAFNSYETGYSLWAVSDPWAEDTITWDSALTLTSTQRCTFAGPEDGFSGWYKIRDPALTTLVQDWVSGGLVIEGLAIKPSLSPESDDEIYVGSKETATAPKLVVHYNSPP